MKKITLLLFTFFFTSLGFSQLPLEGFEGATFPPTNWAVFDIGVGTVDWSTNVNSCQGTLAAYMNRQNVGAGIATAEYLATPSFNVPTNGELRFFSRSFSSQNFGTIYEVRMSPATSPQNNTASYTILLASYTEDQLSAVFNVCDEHVIDLSAFAGQNVFISFVMKYTQPTAALSGDRWLLDNVQVVEKCLDPTALGAAPLATSANLTWTGTGVTFEIENVLGTAAPTGVATGTSSTNSFTQTGLAPNTDYCYYVRAVCTDSSSAWVGPFCYTTTTLPPGCGGNYVDPGGPTGDYGNNLDETVTICPTIAGEQVTVTFTSFDTEANWDGLYVFDGSVSGVNQIPSGNGAGNVPGGVPGSFWGTTIPGPFTSSSPDGCLTFRFRTDTSGVEAGWIANVTCAPPPTCPRPTAVVVVTPATSNSVQVGWTNVGPATAWEIITVPCNSPAPAASATGTPAPTNPFLLTGLSSGTCFDIYVRAVCSSTDISSWSFTPLEVTTQVAPPECGGNFVDPAGISANYANSTDSTVTICPTTPGDQVTVTFTAFDTEANWDGLLVYEGNSTNIANSPQIASANGTGFGFFANVTGAFWGTALPGPFTSSNPNGCLTFRFVSDTSVNRPGWSANITCGPQPACLQPIGLSATLPSSNSVTLNWISNGTSFNIEYGPIGFTPGTGTVVTGVTGSPYTLTGLSSSTQYSFYVQNNCGANGQSAWAGPANFTTQPDYCAGDNFYDLGGANANYPNNANNTTTICAVNSGDQVTVVFNTFNIDATDSLSIHDGNTATAGNLVGTFNGTTLPSSITSTTGCLTFVFVSNGFTTTAGWDASIICSPPPTCSKPIALTVLNVTTTSALLDWTQPLNPDGSTPTSWEVLVLPVGSAAPIGNQPGAVVASIHPFLVTGLQPGTQYTFYVRAICSSTDASFWSTGFNFSTLIINDNCDGAIFAPVNSNAYCNLTIDGTISGATASNVPLAPCVGTADDDSWFQFIATNSYLNISLQSITGTTNNLNHAVYSGNCNNLTLLYCSDPNSSTANGLVVGQTYFIRVYSNENTPQTVDFTLCISTPSTCETSSTVCNTNYANTTGVTSLGTIGCLFTSPNPTFFTIQIVGNGPINYLLTQSTTQGGTPNLDVDYAAWGPFSSQAAVCAAMGNPPSNPLTGLTTGCSYSAAPTENFNIPNAVAGQFYVILITNFSNQQGYISLTQTNAGQPGAGVTFCCSDPDFTYPSFSFCKDGGSNPVVTLGSNSEAGVFSASPSTGLVFVSTATGEIDLAASAPGNYIITNTLAATVSCDERTFTYTIQITEPQTATLNYAETVFCNTDLTVEPAILTGSTIGNYSSSPSGLFINANTGEITPSLSNPGVYNVIYTIAAAGGCPTFTTQPVQIEIIATPNIPQIQDVNVCDSYTLPQLQVGNYYTEAGGLGTLLNAGDVINSSQTIFVFAHNGDCEDEESFVVTIIPTPQVDVLPNISICSSYTLPTLTVGNYFTGAGGTGTQLNAGDSITSTQTIYIYAQSGTIPNCFSESSFTVTIGNLVVTPPASVTSCDTYTLPTLALGNYFTGIGGTGTQLNAGDTITTTQTIYVYAVDGTCTAEDQFTVTIVPTPQADTLPNVSQCGNYILPALTIGNYFTGAGGTGTQLNAGDSITSTQTIYIYAQSGTTPNCFTETSFTVTIGTLVVTAPVSVTSCDTYTLPTLALGNYFTGIGGTGTQLNAGDTITTTQTIYIYAVDGTCTAEDQFTVTIVPTPQADTLPNVSQCGNYILPTLTIGNYFTGAGGTGTQLNAGDSITSTQTIYIYAQSGTTPNCFTETSFTVTIGTLVVTAPVSVTLCDTYTLPTLALGNYFTGIGGTGTQLNAGDTITTTQTIYVYAVDGTCTAEDQFTVTIVPTPQADTLPNVSQCGNYILPTLTIGNYFTGAGGTGTQLNAGDSITSTQTIYIYAQSGTTPNCFTETSFTVTIGTLVVTAPASGSYCGTYTLPTLAIGNYFTGIGGTGTQLNAGDTITSSQTIYVYAVDGTCTAEDSFTVTINSIVADNLADVFACDSYTLPALSPGNNYYTGTNGTGSLISSGTVLTSTQVLYIFAQTGTTPNCTDEQDIVITINTTPLPDAPANVVACDNYTLPALTVGNYYTQTNGGGTQLPAGSVINSNTTLYVYAQSGTSPNCTAENSFTITINSATAQIMQDVSRCDSYTLPALNANNNYYTGTGGTGTQLFAGSTITSSQTIFIYAQSGTTPNCISESSFIVTITPSPVVQPISAVTACDSYTLPALTVGNYYTGQGGTGTLLSAGDTITSTQTIYVFAQSGTSPNCTDEESFVVTINPTPIFTIEGDCIGPVFTLFIASGNLPANPSYQWYNDSTPMGTGATQAITAPGNYSCTISSANTCPSTPTYTAIETNCIVPKGISPNGDGKNDSFDLSGFNVSQLNIYNRYGTIVYSKAQYVNEWFGQSDNGNELPDGTYYYVIERVNAEAKTGWVYINRNAN